MCHKVEITGNISREPHVQYINGGPRQCFRNGTKRTRLILNFVDLFLVTTTAVSYIYTGCGTKIARGVFAHFSKTA